MIVNASSNRSTRWSNGMPNARNSVSFQPAPRPRISRPPLISSMVVACLARSAGLWNAVQATSGPNSIAIGDRGDRRQHRPRLPRAARRAVGPAIEEVLAEPDRVVAEVLDGAGHVEELAPARLALHLGQLDTRPSAGASASTVGARRRRGRARRASRADGRASCRNRRRRCAHRPRASAARSSAMVAGSAR